MRPSLPVTGKNAGKIQILRGNSLAKSKESLILSASLADVVETTTGKASVNVRERRPK